MAFGIGTGVVRWSFGFRIAVNFDYSSMSDLAHHNTTTAGSPSLSRYSLILNTFYSPRRTVSAFPSSKDRWRTFLLFALAYWRAYCIGILFRVSVLPLYILRPCVLRHSNTSFLDQESEATLFLGYDAPANTNAEILLL